MPYQHKGFIMRQTILKKSLFFLFLAASTILFAQNSTVEKVDISKLDRSMTIHKAQKRTFKNKEEFKRHQKKIVHHKKTHAPHPKVQKHAKHYRDERYPHHRYIEDYDYDYYGMPTHRYRHYGRAYRHFKRGWILAYKYDRAEFYDRDGFHYGYFNRYGYMFEGEFYRYDRYYRYRDRVRGRGLFDRYYYRPTRWKYYGFCR